VELPEATPKENERRIAEKRVNIAINMSDVCVRIPSDAVRDRNQGSRRRSFWNWSERESCTEDAECARFRNWRILRHWSRELSMPSTLSD